MVIDRQVVEDYLDTLDISKSVPLEELHTRVSALLVLLTGYDKAYIVAGEDTIDVYGERLENNTEYEDRLEIESEYREGVRKWLEESVRCAGS